MSSTSMLSGSLVAIASAMSPTVPLAVGTMSLDAKDIKDDDKGKAVHILHTYKDALWLSGSKSHPPAELDSLQVVLEKTSTAVGSPDLTSVDALASQLESSTVSEQPSVAHETLTAEGKVIAATVDRFG